MHFSFGHCLYRKHRHFLLETFSITNLKVRHKSVSSRGWLSFFPCLQGAWLTCNPELSTFSGYSLEWWQLQLWSSLLSSPKARRHYGQRREVNVDCSIGSKFAGVWLRLQWNGLCFLSGKLRQLLQQGEQLSQWGRGTCLLLLYIPKEDLGCILVSPLFP